MKSFKIFLFAIFLTTGTLGAAQTVIDQDDSNNRPTVNINSNECGYGHPLRVAGMIGNPPFGWVERHDEKASKELESYGLGRLVLDKICAKLGISYVSTGFLSYNKAIVALKNGDIDLLLASYYLPQNLGKGAKILTPAYFQNVFTVYFKKGKEIPATSFNDLEGWKGIIRREENIYPLIRQELPHGIDLTQVSTAKKAFEMLMNGEADYLIGSPYAIEAELRRFKLNDDIVSASQVLFHSNLFFVFTTNSDCRKIQKEFSKTLGEEDFSAPQIQEMAQKLIDNWGERFRENPGLLEEQEEEKSEIKSSVKDMTPPISGKN